MTTKKDPGLEKAKKFLDQYDGGLKVYEVEWTCRAQWHVCADSKAEVERVVQKYGVSDLRTLFHDDVEVWVSEDQVERAKEFRKKFGRELEVGEPTVGISYGEAQDIGPYLAERVWDLLRRWCSKAKCQHCGHKGGIRRWVTNGSPRQVVPELACPECKLKADWAEMLVLAMPVPVSVVKVEEEERRDGAHVAEG